MTLLTKETARCCRAKVDDLGRPPIGFCGPNCERRRQRDRFVARRENEARRTVAADKQSREHVRAGRAAPVKRPSSAKTATDPPPPSPRPATCIRSGCVRAAVERGWCKEHRP